MGENRGYLETWRQFSFSLFFLRPTEKPSSKTTDRMFLTCCFCVLHGTRRVWAWLALIVLSYEYIKKERKTSKSKFVSNLEKSVECVPVRLCSACNPSRRHRRRLLLWESDFSFICCLFFISPDSDACSHSAFCVHRAAPSAARASTITCFPVLTRQAWRLLQRLASRVFFPRKKEQPHSPVILSLCLFSDWVCISFAPTGGLLGGCFVRRNSRIVVSVVTFLFFGFH